MSLIHWWQLNGDLKDYGTNPIDLTNNGATVDNSGKIGKCYYLNGSNNFLRAAYPNTIKPTDTISICGWYKASSTTTAHHIISCYEGGGVGLTAARDRSIMIMQIYTGGAYHDARTSFPDTNWHHWAGTFDGRYIKIYLDGVLKGTTDLGSGTHTISYNSTTPWMIGANPTPSGVAGGDYTNGYMNDIRIYDHALSTKEVKEISKGLVLDYNFENDVVSSGKIYDNSGYGNNGTIYSGVDLGSNSPVGQQYCHIPELSTIICPTTNFNRTDELTYSVYFRHYGQGSASWTWLFTNGRVDGAGYGYGAQITNDTTINCFWGNRTIQGVTIPKNEWHLLTVSIKGLTQNLYVDGVYQKSGTASSLPDYTNGVGLGLGCFYYSSGQIYKSECDIADFKIYATALSTDDIKLEYQRKASIDKNGNLFSPEFIEDNTNIKITNTQITKAGQFVEGNTKAQFKETYDDNSNVIHINQVKEV